MYVRALRAPNERRVQVSTNGGREPLWAPGGRELFYLAPDGTLMGVPIEAGTGEPTFLTPRAVIGAGASYTEAAFHRGRSYDVSADGAPVSPDQDRRERPGGKPDSRRFVIVENWTEELKRLQPRN